MRGREPVIGDVESSEMGGVPLLLGLSVGALLALTLVAFLFGRALGGRLVVLGGYHNRLQSGSMLSSRVENLSARRYNSSMVTGGSIDRDWKNGVVGPKLLLKFCKTASILYTSIY